MPAQALPYVGFVYTDGTACDVVVGGEGDEEVLLTKQGGAVETLPRYGFCVDV